MTADAPAQWAGQPPAPQAAPTPVKSVGERSTRQQIIDDGVSSMGGGTGQQMTGAETKLRRQRQRRWMVTGAVALLLCASGVTTWQLLRTPKPANPRLATLASALTSGPAKPPTEAPATLTSPPSAAAAPKPIVEPLAPSPVAVKPTAQEPAKPKAGCTLVRPTAECIHGDGLSSALRQEVLGAINDSHLKMCSSERLVFVATGSLFQVRSAPSSIKRSMSNLFLLSLKGYLRGRDLPGEVEIRCTAR